MSDESSIVHPRDEENDFRPLDARIADLAGRQHGLAARRQLLRMASRGEIDGRIARGGLRPVHRGVYAVGHEVLSVEGRWMAAVLAGGADAVLSHRSAGQLWGLMPRGTVWLEVTRPRGWHGAKAIVFHCSVVPGDEVTNVEGIRVTSVFRTILDLASVLGKRRLEKVLNEAEVRGLTDSLSLPELLARHPGRRGATNLCSLLDANAPGGITRSELEDRFVALVDAHDLPRPRLNTDVAIDGRFFEVDCLWPDQRLVVELDGRSAHGTARAFEGDRARDRLLTADGYRVVRVTWRQLRDDAPAVVADMRRLLNFETRPLTL